jgi:hypothetical protein
MDDATRGADNIRSDIGALAQRYTVIDREEECGVREWCHEITGISDLLACVPVAVFLHES